MRFKKAGAKYKTLGKYSKGEIIWN